MTTQQHIIRKSADRGHFDHGWLDTFHTFSFGSYQDAEWMDFGPLRVINEDYIAARMGFGEHGHRDMEIITYPVSGAVRHRDSLGHEEDITPGMIQHMRAGSGIRHSEFNPLDERTHMLQIWIQPRELGLEPSHSSRSFPIHEQPGELHLLASPDGEGDSLSIAQDARLWAGVFAGGDSKNLEIGGRQDVWVQVIGGALSANGAGLSVGDGLGIRDISTLELRFEQDSEVLIFALRSE